MKTQTRHQFRHFISFAANTKCESKSRIFKQFEERIFNLAVSKTSKKIVYFTTGQTNTISGYQVT